MRLHKVASSWFINIIILAIFGSPLVYHRPHSWCGDLQIGRLHHVKIGGLKNCNVNIEFYKQN
jgi:hypothetical protein